MKQIYIRILLCTLFVVIYSNGFSQKPKDRKTKIHPTSVEVKIKEYDNYLKKWAFDNNIKSYIITLKTGRLNELTTFKLNVVLFGLQIDLFKPTTFATVDEIPVLINDSLDSLQKKDLELIEFLKITYWKEGTLNAKESERKQLLAYKESLKSLSDSVIVYDKIKKKRVTVSRSSFTPLIWDPELSKKYVYPQSWVLHLKGKEIVDQFTLN